VEMRPARPTPAHRTDRLAELVCSNSLGSDLPDRAGGLLKAELRRLGSLIIAAAERAAVPAGGALAVDRDAFAAIVTRAIEDHPRIDLVRDEATAVPDGPCVVATGPLTSDRLATDLRRLTGQDHLYFYDALAPIVTAESIDLTVAFRQSRHDRGDTDGGDYINCPLDEPAYRAFVAALLAAERIPLRDFEHEAEVFFEGCLPIEVIAARSPDALAFGPMRPIGLRDPRTGRRPFAVVQLRQDNVAGSLYNLVGFQTNLRWGDQERVLRMIPGLAGAEFVRLGQMHRNTFINAPALLTPGLAFRGRPGLYFAGQITGIEGYTGNAASGLLAGLNAARALSGHADVVLPPTTMLGALCHYITACDPDRFQPMKANFGLLPPLEPAIRHKAERYRAYGARALADLDACLARHDIPLAEEHAQAPDDVLV
ncbi:MAG: methylenetetrahydrofolate--tRNA-(uracil(54)-C(5))-methyltransferase (FADH(2)-oxidizing) TrmFO, partial [Chloroflexi bacterium CFX6]|nr:methylenetetrahydrofolate--tRNA-(uracil(54)-C(5))-methyltransferase (FADH(2)-oxidizing) TrmFO [Chloroflexi bacterium CFX6]